MHSKIVLISFVVIIFVSIGHGLKCYTCEQPAGGCKKKINCSSGSEYCSEALLQTTQNQTTASHDCVKTYPILWGEICGPLMLKGYRAVMCVCSTDFCNDGKAVVKKLPEQAEHMQKGRKNEGNNKTVMSWIVSLGVILVIVFKSFVY